MTNREEQIDAILKLHGAKATHVESVPVKEVFHGKTVWDGIVEVFDLTGHPKTHRAYAWSYIAGDYGKCHITALHIPPVVSPRTAVQAAIDARDSPDSA
jgi:hypothetical protein